MLVKLDTLVARYDELNRLKTQRALDLMSRYGQQVFQLLPVMLHFNHPLLPGYVSGDVPHGIWSFSATAEQQAFIDEQAAQCGYCMNGMIMTAKALLDRNPHPSEEQVLNELSANLCRCGTHLEIVRAVMRAARQKP